MLLGSLAFATMGVLARALKEVVVWQVSAVARTTLVLVFAGTLALAAGVRLVLWRPTTLWVRSLAGSLSLVGTFYCFTHLPLAEVYTLTNMFPIWVALLSWPLLGEPAPASVWVAVVSGVVGVALVQQPYLLQGNWATLIALASSVSTAIAMIGLHRLKGVDTRAVVVHFSAVGALFSVACLFLFEQETRPLEPAGLTLLGLLGIGVMATAGQLLLTRAFATAPPTKISVVGLTQIVFAMLFEVVLWQRTFEPQTLAGMALIVAPTAWLMTHRAPGVKDSALDEISRMCDET
jgi:drug/metabolite transporter (DMT)-like permease